MVVVVADGAGEDTADGEAAAVAPGGGAGVGVAGAPAVLRVACVNITNEVRSVVGDWRLRTKEDVLNGAEFLE